MFSQVLSRSFAQEKGASAGGPPKADATPDLPSADPGPAPDALSVTSDSAPLRTDDPQTGEKKPASNGRKRFSWLTIVYTTVAIEKVPKPALPSLKERNGAQDADVPKQKKSGPLAARSRSDKKAMRSALLVRELIVGPSSNAAADTKARNSNAYGPKLATLKTQLMNPKYANKVIAQLRMLASSDSVVAVPAGGPGEATSGLPKGPIHAVCLQYTDAEVHERHFTRLSSTTPAGQTTTTEAGETTARVSVERGVSAQATAAREVVSITTASFAEVQAIFEELHVVSLITAPDLGLGQPADEEGLLSGALPTAKTVIEGIEQVTPQLMALGYATGKAILPDHAGVYPPTDRMSVLTYWWGFELVLPESSLDYLDQNVPSVAHAIINFLTALSMVEGGVREILPFVRYISQYIDSEFNLIKGQDEGQGVVCAATWLMPAALVPRPWDFPQPPVTAPSAPGGTDRSNPASTPESPAEGVSEPAPSLPSPITAPMVVVSAAAAPQPEASTTDAPVKVTSLTPPASQVLASPGEVKVDVASVATQAS
ncbi:hypothetical protein OBBRIDRAFT_641316 [Obba rivulosa]|uniref:Uncharacterized protein n=1 Tax=Obba rivulosa TaxID=1052685 RepID=A0A8E2J5M3_9APHY|nr:hypothetical protein OBBRIDRAFT_641316 [Obba rivulosa]